MINLAIIGYGNLGKGVENALKFNEDFNLVGIFTRRDVSSINTTNNVYSIDDILNFKDKIDVCILCGSSLKDLTNQTPYLSKYFNTIDSFDMHKLILEHQNNVNKICKKNKTVSIISTGWDPGYLSIQRIYSNSFLPNGNDETFWGKGVSQGHSDALRKVEGVIDAVQYTVPNLELIEEFKKNGVKLNSNLKHIRECYVVCDENYDKNVIESNIKNMAHYFKEYNTIVNFITQEELNLNHKKMPHGGKVLRYGSTSDSNKHLIEFSLKLDSNPEFTASVLVSYARAAYLLSKEKKYGCFNVFDIAPKYLINKSYEEIIKEML